MLTRQNPFVLMDSQKGTSGLSLLTAEASSPWQRTDIRCLAPSANSRGRASEPPSQSRPRGQHHCPDATNGMAPRGAEGWPPTSWIGRTRGHGDVHAPQSR